MTDGPLIRPDELAALLGEVTVLDVRYLMGGPPGEAQHRAGHVPGAAYVDMDLDLADPPGEGGRHPLPDEARFEDAMRRAGVRGDRPVVAYDDWQGRGAAPRLVAAALPRPPGRAGARRRVVGVGRGRSPGRERRGRTERGDFAVTADKQMPVVRPDDVMDVDVLVDARAAERFARRGRARRPGGRSHPGRGQRADHVQPRRATAASGRRPSCARRTPDVGADTAASVAAYCGSGVTAAHDILAMEVAGISAALYPGSWSGWITDPDRPVERD